MPLWGKSTANESKPKYLNAEDSTNTYATKQGWVLKRADGTEELLVAIGGLAQSLANPDVTDIFFANTNASYIRNANTFVTVGFNEKVNVTGSPTINVVGSSANAVATYASGTGTNKLLFRFTVPNSAQTLSLAAQNITLAGGTIQDAANTAVSANLVIQIGDVKGVRGKAGANSQIAVA